MGDPYHSADCGDSTSCADLAPEEFLTFRSGLLTELTFPVIVSPMKCFRHRDAAAAVVLVAASLLAGCSKPAPEQPPPAAPPYHPVASIREVMNSVIDPNVDVVWNAVKTVIDHGKPIEHAPANDEEWAAVRHSALTVAEGTNLLMMPGRATGRRVPGAGHRAGARPGSRADRQESRRLEPVRASAPGLFAAGPGRDRQEGSAGAVRGGRQDRRGLRELPSDILVSGALGIGIAGIGSGPLTRIGDL